MDDLDNYAKMFQDAFALHKWLCPICGEEMPDDEDAVIEAYRIRNSKPNILSYGEKVILHPMNKILVDKAICAEKVSRGWEHPKNDQKRIELVKSIRDEIERWEKAAIKACEALYTPRPKKKR